MTLSKAKMVENLFDELGLNKSEAKAFIEMFFEEVYETLERGESVKFAGFGNFVLRDKNQRSGRNPKTGKEALVSARRVVVFRPGQKLRLRVKDYIGVIE